mmetsp:Transcript_126693/g.370185  ORF Transcript_126693/g.370185 Transcript_126693/m.370185 type:complete len:469 (+) Transcript_126693:92-1498(+)
MPERREKDDQTATPRLYLNAIAPVVMCGVRPEQQVPPIPWAPVWGIGVEYGRELPRVHAPAKPGEVLVVHVRQVSSTLARVGGNHGVGRHGEHSRARRRRRGQLRVGRIALPRAPRAVPRQGRLQRVRHALQQRHRRGDGRGVVAGLRQALVQPQDPVPALAKGLLRSWPQGAHAVEPRHLLDEVRRASRQRAVDDDVPVSQEEPLEVAVGVRVDGGPMARTAAPEQRRARGVRAVGLRGNTRGEGSAEAALGEGRVLRDLQPLQRILALRRCCLGRESGSVLLADARARVGSQPLVHNPLVLGAGFRQWRRTPCGELLQQEPQAQWLPIHQHPHLSLATIVTQLKPLAIGRLRLHGQHLSMPADPNHLGLSRRFCPGPAARVVRHPPPSKNSRSLPIWRVCGTGLRLEASEQSCSKNCVVCLAILQAILSIFDGPQMLLANMVVSRGGVALCHLVLTLCPSISHHQC